MNLFFPVDRFLSLGVLVVLLLDSRLFRSSARSTGGRFDLAHQYARSHELRGVEGLLSYGELLLLLAFLAYMVVFGRRQVPEQGFYLLGGLGGSVVLLLYQCLKWYWAAKLCVGLPTCTPSENWGPLPFLLPFSFLLLGYFAWRVLRTRLFHFIAHNRG